MPASICCWSPSTARSSIRIFACASEAAAQGKLDADMLKESAARLDRAFPKPPLATSPTPPADAPPTGE